GRRPLLQLDYDDIPGPVRADAGDQEIDALGRLRNAELDCNAGVIGDVAAPQHPGHCLKGVTPRPELSVERIASSLLSISLRDDIVGPVVLDVFHDLRVDGPVYQEAVSPHSPDGATTRAVWCPPWRRRKPSAAS